MREQFGVIGLGACGSNIANLFETKNYNTVYVNTSKEDLDAIKGVHKVHISGAEGAAKDRKRVLQLATETFPDIIEKIESIIPQKYILVLKQQTFLPITKKPKKKTIPILKTEMLI